MKDASAMTLTSPVTSASAQAPATPLDVIVDTRTSPHARHRPVPVGNVRIDDEFFTPRRDINRTATLVSQYQHLIETNRFRNFERVAGKFDGPFDGIYFNDSDVYKWLEAAAWAIAAHPDESDELRNLCDEAIAIVAAAQDASGYLNTYFSVDRVNERWSNLEVMHELYCAGHLFQAAVAHHRATGQVNLLDIATRFADLICEQFGPAAEGKQEQTDGHPEVEMGLVELYRVTGDRKYLEQARFFTDIRGYGKIGGKDYHQDRTPLRQQAAMVGHAVRAVYLNAGAADLVAEEGDQTLRTALDAMWENQWTRRAYVSGGIGSRWEGEAFGKDYELPNARAYTESCAAIGSMMWAWRQQSLTVDDNTRYADAFEHTLYNAMLPGLSLDGQAYFYQNPLEDDGTHRRAPWFGCACCPPNIARFLAQLGGYFYSVTSRRFPESDGLHDMVWTHLYANSEAVIPLQRDGSVTIRQTTRYPWDGAVRVEIVDLVDAGDFTLYLRIPGWATEAKGTLNGEPLPATETAAGQYATIRRTWQVGDVVELTFPMSPRRLVAHPRVSENAGRVALMRGPLLYCIEAADHQLGDVRDYVLPADAGLHAAWRPDMLEGVMVLTADAEIEAPAPGWDGALYRTVEDASADQAGRSHVTLTAIPYYAWANRGAGPMTVWIRHGQ
jgi:DUF1680 family protein